MCPLQGVSAWLPRRDGKLSRQLIGGNHPVCECEYVCVYVCVRTCVRVCMCMCESTCSFR